MSRISHSIPMKAYDHVKTILTEAGGKDGVIARKDADALVAKLEKEGRGTEAMAARNIFTIIDARDTASGSRVTSFDLEKDRGFVESKMLENRDVNRNGYSQEEIARMSPTGRALVELGRVLDIEAKPGRIAKTIPEAGVDHIAGMLKTIADPIASRGERDALVAKLKSEGRGTEALAVSFFFSFIDHRDAAPGSRVTAADIDRAVTVAKDTLLGKKDANNNGFSAAEVANFSTTAKAFLLVGQMIEAGIIR